MHNAPGPITLLGSGETSLAGGRIFEDVVKKLSRPVNIALLETPAGFELNSAQVAGRVAEFLQRRRQNYDPRIEVIPARKRGTEFSPDNEILLEPLKKANLIFMGPGSPTYAIRQLKSSRAWELVKLRQRMGAALFFASAAVIAVSAWALPVYEIYKVGQDVHAVEGLDLLAEMGLKISFIPHWNNSDGGADVDTSRCFAGVERFEAWRKLTPAENIIVGVDEHTGLTIDFSAEKCRVSGVGTVTLTRNERKSSFSSGEEFPLSELGKLLMPKPGLETSPVNENEKMKNERPPARVLELIEQRNAARRSKDWTTADEIRRKVAEMGWQIQDLPEEQRASKIEDG